MSSPAVQKRIIRLRDVNRHLVCRLCHGYYIDATTISECLHSFCRSCIVTYLEKNSYCPVCEVQIHKTKPYLSLRLDKALQDLVYKLVPGLYQNEMARRQKFFQDKPHLALMTTTPEERGVQERLIFSPEDMISLKLTCLHGSTDPELESVSSQSSESGEDFPLQLGLMKVAQRPDAPSRTQSTESNESSSNNPHYLLCPAVVSIRIIKKFLTIKYELPSTMKVDILHKSCPLLDHYTLMDVAYIFTWKRMEPMKLYYQLYRAQEQQKCEETQVTNYLPIAPEPTLTPVPSTSKAFVSSAPIVTMNKKQVGDSVSCRTYEPKKFSQATDNPNISTKLPFNDKDKELQKTDINTMQKVADCPAPVCPNVPNVVPNVPSALVDQSKSMPIVASHGPIAPALLQTSVVTAESPSIPTKNEASVKTDVPKPMVSNVRMRAGRPSVACKSNKPVDALPIQPPALAKTEKPLLKVADKDGESLETDAQDLKLNSEVRVHVERANVGNGVTAQSTPLPSPCPATPGSIIDKQPHANSLKDETSVQTETSAPLMYHKIRMRIGRPVSRIKNVKPKVLAAQPPAPAKPVAADKQPLIVAKKDNAEVKTNALVPKLNANVLNNERATQFSSESADIKTNPQSSPVSSVPTTPTTAGWHQSGLQSAPLQIPNFRPPVPDQQKLPPNQGKHPLPVGLVKKSADSKMQKTNVKLGQKLVLNHISGKLEPVPCSPEKDVSLKIAQAKPSKLNVQRLMTFRKEKSTPKNNNSVSISTTPIKEKPPAKEEANVSIEIKTDKNEYDFDSCSPPSRIMSLNEYTKSAMFRTNYMKNGDKQLFGKSLVRFPEPEQAKKDKSKTVPSLYRISDKSKNSPAKCAKPCDDSLRIINIQTPDPTKTAVSSAKRMKLENKGGECAIKQANEGGKTPKREAVSEADAEMLRLLLKKRDAAKAKAENGKRPKTPAPVPVQKPLKPPTPIDLMKPEPSHQGKIPLESLMELAKKPLDPKKDHDMLEMLVNIAQKQSIEPLLKIPQLSQNPKSGTPSQLSPSDINHALKFFQKLSSDMLASEAKPHTEPPKPANTHIFQQCFSQQLELVRMMKRQQAMANEVTPKIAKRSPPRDEKKSPKEDATVKTLEHTISQIQEQTEIHRMLIAAQTAKMLPGFLQYYNPASSNFMSGQTSPHPITSPNSQKPSSSVEDNQQHALSQQEMFNAGLTSEMTTQQMFRMYLKEQDRMNGKSVKQAVSPGYEQPPEKKGVFSQMESPPAAEKAAAVSPAAVTASVAEGTNARTHPIPHPVTASTAALSPRPELSPSSTSRQPPPSIQLQTR